MKTTNHANKLNKGKCAKRRHLFSFQLSAFSFHSFCLLPSAFCLSLLLFTPAQSLAFEFDGSLKEVKITDSSGTNTPPTAVINYTKNGDTFSFDASNSTAPDGSIVDYKWDFGDGTTGFGVSVSHTYSGYGQFYVTLKVLDNNGSISVSQNTISKVFNIAVNFQPPGSPIPDGFVADSGLNFDITRGYGWTVKPSLSFQDRDSTISPDQSYDTIATFKPPGTWELAIPNGIYNITVAVGDSYLSETYVQNVQAEHITIIDNIQLMNRVLNWQTSSKFVEVNDGKLTITFDGSTKYAKICWLRVTQ